MKLGPLMKRPRIKTVTATLCCYIDAHIGMRNQVDRRYTSVYTKSPESSYKTSVKVTATVDYMMS